METRKSWTLAELAGVLSGEPRGDLGILLARPVPAGEDDPQGVTFAESEEFLSRALGSTVGAVIVPRGTPDFPKPAILVDSPRAAFFHLLALCDHAPSSVPGVHATAVVHPSAQVAATARIGANCVVEEDAVVGTDAILHPLSFVGPRCRVGERSRLMPGAVLVQDVDLGPDVVVQSGAVLGSDGFGFYWDGERQVKVPQVGQVSVGPSVEIGANTTVDRATCGSTKIGEGVKLDNLVQIGHNSEVGAHTVMAGQVGVSGSVSIGERCVVGGQAAFADHVTCGDDVVLAGRSGLLSDLTEPGEYFGVPPTPVVQAMRALALQQRLPELLKRIRELEHEVEQLKSGR